jgi:hypothetical protein
VAAALIDVGVGTVFAGKRLPSWLTGMVGQGIGSASHGRERATPWAVARRDAEVAAQDRFARRLK